MSGPQTSEEKLERVTTILQAFDKAIVAFSGGVDSMLLLSLAMEAIGAANVLAVTADSPSLSRRDLDDARRLVREVRARHLVIETDELDNPNYQANRTDRCYLCKRTLFVELEELAQRLRIPAILYGAIGEDLAAERPGQRAAAERGIHAPLQDAGFEKWEVRELAHQRGLSNWDKPQDACLSSRVPHGQAVTPEKLRQIEIAEDALVTLGFHQVRVRHFGSHARIEVGVEEVRRFEDEALRGTVVRRFLAMGFSSVGIDRRGYRSGSANRSDADERLLATSDKRQGGVAQLVRAAES